MLTPKQVLFFEPFIENLRERGDDVRVTSRHYREAELMVRKRGLKVDFVGAHGGKNLSPKLLASIERMRLLQEMFDGDPPDFAVSFSSPEAARVAYGLGMMNVTVNDSPHATAVARLTLPLSDALLCPWIIPNEAWTRYGVSRGKIFHYKALDPFVWLKRRDLSNTDMPDLDLDYSKGTIVLRLEESFALFSTDINISRSCSQHDIPCIFIEKGCQNHSDIGLCGLGNLFRDISGSFHETPNGHHSPNRFWNL